MGENFPDRNDDVRLLPRRMTRKSETEFNQKDLKSFCAGRMAKFMVPRHIEFIDEMPRTPTGKPEKGKLATL